MERNNENENSSTLEKVKILLGREFSLEEIGRISKKRPSIFQRKSEDIEQALNRFGALGFTLEETKKIVLQQPGSLEDIDERIDELKRGSKLNMSQIRDLFITTPKVMSIPLEKMKELQGLEKNANIGLSGPSRVVDFDTIFSFATGTNYVGEKELYKIARFIGGETVGEDLSSYDDYDVYMAVRELILKRFPELEDYRSYGSMGIDERTRNGLVHAYGNEFVLTPRPKEMKKILSERENNPDGFHM